MNQFIAFRALQGLGAGIGIALAFVLVADMFPPAGARQVAEPVRSRLRFRESGWPNARRLPHRSWSPFGTLVTDTTRWRWVFYINIPVGIIVLAALLIYLPANISARTNRHTGWAAVRRIDFLGAVLSATATISLLLGLTWGSNGTYDWNSPQVIGILVAAIVLFATFVIAERFAVEPILPLNLFRNRVFAVASFLSLAQLMVLVGLLIYLPLFLQGVLGVSATSSGAVITPMTVSSVIGAALAGLAITIFKRYRLITIVSSFVMTVGVFLLILMTPTTGLLVVVIFMVIAGIGLGPFFSVLTIAAQNALPRTRLGIGTSAVRYLGQLGSVLGVAIVGTVVNNTACQRYRAPSPGLRRNSPDARGVQGCHQPTGACQSCIPKYGGQHCTALCGTERCGAGTSWPAARCDCLSGGNTGHAAGATTA